jgi:hypothetical protein
VLFLLVYIIGSTLTFTAKFSLERSLVMSDKPVNQDIPTLGQTSDTYDDTAVFLSGKLREHSNHSLGNVLTAIEAALGDTKQCEALKSLVRRELFLMTDRNQAEVYVRAKMQRAGLEPKEVHMFQDEDGEYDGHTIRQVTAEAPSIKDPNQ